VAHHLSPETCEDELKTITRKLYTYRVYRDIFLAICATISLIVLFYSFQVSEDIIEECNTHTTLIMNQLNVELRAW